MLIPDKLLEHLADRFVRESIDSVRYPFVSWAAVEAEKLGFKF
ncbi:hypothetical protein ABE142_26390 [Paenibacillus alvei]|nr:hypothetical protein [Paenibacillus alvei]EJW19936.1 hypothetical protein PAV_1c09240 [Paenibacillus alvei DSM 29]MEC0084650.1 hypothetical protein [Paenibacillus alvei]